MFRRIIQALTASRVESLEPRQMLAADQVMLLAAGDLNGDGAADVAIIHRDLATRNILLSTRISDRKGGVIRRDSMDLTPEEFAAMTIGDVNGDGLPDIVIAGNTRRSAAQPGGQGQVSVILGDGTGGFATDAQGTPKMATLPLPDGTRARGVAVGDLDGDGAPDLAVLGVTSPRDAQSGLPTGRRQATIDMLWSAPKGTEPSRAFDQLPLDQGVRVDTLASGDVDGDGVPDLVVYGAEATRISRLRNHANVVTILGLADHKGTAVAQQNPLYQDSGHGGQNPLFERGRTIGLGDLDGDGRPELIGMTARKNGAVVAADFDYKTLRWMAPEAIQQKGRAPFSASQIVVGDFDGDGRSDLAAVSRTGVSDFGMSRTLDDGTAALIWSPRSNVL